MLYKTNYKQVIKRLNHFYLGGGRGRICARMMTPNPVLEHLQREQEDGPVPCPDLYERADFWDEHLSYCHDLQDDSIPCAYLSEVDQGLVGGMLGGKVEFLLDTSIGWISSMVHRFTESLRDAYQFKIDTENFWYKRLLEQLEIYTNRAAGKFGVSHWCNLDGLHLVTEMRGFTSVYYDILDEPETCKHIINFAYRMGLFLQNTFFDRVGLFEGGTCSNMAQWLPGRCISESVDMYHMAAPSVFEEWGREPLQRMVDQFDGTVMHIHSNGHHLIEHIKTVKNLRSILLLDDPWATPIYQGLDKLDPLRGEVSYNIFIPYEVFAERLVKRELHPNTFYTVKGVPDIREANAMMKDVWAYYV